MKQKKNFKIDAHFHPNLPFWSDLRTQKKCQEYWDAFARVGLDIAICMEHVYKKPKQSFETLLSFKPQSHKTTLLPGIEYITKEGIDILLYAKKPEDIYIQDFIRPYALSLCELWENVKNSAVECIIPHPDAPSKTGIIHNLGFDKAQEFIQQIGCIESYNGAFQNVVNLGKKLNIESFVEFLRKGGEYSLGMPKNCKQVVGSDAHYPDEIGPHMITDGSIGGKEIVIAGQSNEASFRKLIRSIVNLISESTAKLFYWLFRR